MFCTKLITSMRVLYFTFWGILYPRHYKFIFFSEYLSLVYYSFVRLVIGISFTLSGFRRKQGCNACVSWYYTVHPLWK